jgi:hypothetical protein
VFVVSVVSLVISPSQLRATVLPSRLQTVVLFKTNQMGVFCPIQVAVCVDLFAIKRSPRDVISSPFSALHTHLAFLTHVGISLCILVTRCLAKYPLDNETRDSFIATSVTLWGEFPCHQVYTDESLSTTTIRSCRNSTIRERSLFH